MPDLSVTIGNLKLKNPILAGAGPIAGTVEHIKRCADAGFGGICTKTAAQLVYIQRYPWPLYTLVDYKANPQDPFHIPNDYTWLHREHNSIFPAEQFAKIIAQSADYCHSKGTAIIGSIAGRSVEEWERLAKAYEQAGCDALELNFCCPFPPKEFVSKPDEAFMGISFSMNPDLGARAVERVKKAIQIPVFPKLSPDGTDFVGMARLFKNAGADGITMFANNNVLRIDIEAGRPINYGPCAGTFPQIKAVTLRWVGAIAKEVGMPIFAGRGATRWQDAVEFIMAGATGVQFCSPIMLHGLGYVKTLVDGLEAFMVRKDYRKMKDIHGRAVKHLLSARQFIEKVKPRYAAVDYDKCEGCFRCYDVCWYDAIKKLRRKIQVIKENCSGCTLCTQVCPSGALITEERESVLEHFQAMAAAHKDLVPEDIYPGKGIQEPVGA